MNSEEIKRFVEKSENADVEFKRARSGIILGVREKGGRREIEGLAAEVYVGEERFGFADDKLPFGCC